MSVVGDRAWAAKIAAACPSDDPEVAHLEADHLIIELLQELGYAETAAAWQAVEKWYA